MSSKAIAANQESEDSKCEKGRVDQQSASRADQESGQAGYHGTSRAEVHAVPTERRAKCSHVIDHRGRSEHRRKNSESPPRGPRLARQYESDTNSNNEENVCGPD